MDWECSDYDINEYDPFDADDMYDYADDVCDFDDVYDYSNMCDHDYDDVYDYSDVYDGEALQSPSKRKDTGSKPTLTGNQMAANSKSKKILKKKKARLSTNSTEKHLNAKKYNKGNTLRRSKTDFSKKQTIGVSKDRKISRPKSDILGPPFHSKVVKRIKTEQPNPKHRRKRPKLDLLQVFRKYSAAKVKIPKDRTQWAKKMADTHLEYIRKYCKKNASQYFSHFEYTGSFYEHLKAEDANELDILVVLDTKEKANLVIEEVVPGYARIKATTGSSKYVSGKFTSGNERYVKPQKVRSRFFSVLQKAVNQYKQEKKDDDPILKVSDHGPAIILLINDKVNAKKLSVDLVPAFLFKEKNGDGDVPAKGTYYVAKELPEELASKHSLPCEREMIWRRSFSLDEKKTMANLDKEDTGCRREVLKIIKTIVQNDSTLAKLSSYHLKTTFLHYNFAEENKEIDWSGQSLECRCNDMLFYLREDVKEKKLSHYFIPELNLLEELTSTTLTNIEGRLTKLLDSENEMRNVLAVKPGFDRFASVKASKRPKRKVQKLKKQ